MQFLETKLKGTYIIDPDCVEDERGFFARSFCKQEFERRGLCNEFVQCSISFNLLKGTLRGIHYQSPPQEETKLIRCTMGTIYDVIVDLRPHSKTLKEWIGVELSAHNRRMLYVPHGFAHGFMTLADSSEVFYQISPAYVPSSAKGLRWDDPALSIEWPGHPVMISERDKTFPLLTAQTE